MKKFLSLILIALMMFTVLFVSVSCKEEPEQATPDRSESWDAKTKAEHCDPILPAGSVKLKTGFSIPMTWSADAKGLKDLPAVTYSFAGAIDSTTNVSQALKDAVLSTPQSFFDTTPTNIIFHENVASVFLDLSLTTFFRMLTSDFLVIPSGIFDSSMHLLISFAALRT